MERLSRRGFLQAMVGAIAAAGNVSRLEKLLQVVEPQIKTFALTRSYSYFDLSSANGLLKEYYKPEMIENLAFTANPYRADSTSK